MRLVGDVRRSVPIVAACVLLICGRAAAAPPVLPSTPASQAWEFTDLDGGRHTIDWSERDTGALLLCFFDLRSSDSLLGLNFCDALFTLARDYGLTVVGVEVTGGEAAAVRTQLQGYAGVYRTPAFPIVADPQFAAAKRFDAGRAPATLLIGARGGVVARRSAFTPGVAVELTRRVEQLLRRNEGFLSPALRNIGVSESDERELAARTAAAGAQEESALKPLTWGDRLPAFEYRDAAGRSGRWAWPGGVIRVAFFWSVASATAAEDLAFFQRLQEQVGSEFLEVIAVESTGLNATLVAETLADIHGRKAALPFPVVPDPHRVLRGLFGAGDLLPQSFLIGVRGEVLYRADGFDPKTKRMIEEKIGRAARLAGLGLPHAPNEVPRSNWTGAGGGEAPSISRRLERDGELRFNLSRGDYFFVNGQYARAVPHYLRYRELEPGSLHSLVRLAQCHDLMRDPGTAREYWEKVLGMSPGHAEAHRRLKELGPTLNR